MRGPIEYIIDASREEGKPTLSEEIQASGMRETDQLAKIGLLTGAMFSIYSLTTAWFFMEERNDLIEAEANDFPPLQAFEIGMEVVNYTINKGFAAMSILSAVCAVEGFNFKRRARKHQKELLSRAIDPAADN